MATITPPHRGAKPAHHIRLARIAVVAAALILGVIVGLVAARGDWSSGSGVQGSGVPASQARATAAFSGLDLAGSNNVTVTVGGPRSVVVHADSNLLSYVTTKVVAGTLVIGDSGSYTTRTPMSVDVSVPSLSALNLSGDGQITVTGISAPRLTVHVSGSGLLSASGTVSRLDVVLSGAGHAQLGQLTARDVHAAVTGSGLIQVTATTSLHAEVPGTGAITYSGNPSQVTSSVTGTGAITRG